MSESPINVPAEIASIDLELAVVLKVVPKVGQGLDEAASEMKELFSEYVTGDHNFMDDYGVKADELRAHWADPEGVEPPLNGFEGPFCLEARVRSAGDPVHDAAEYHRAIGNRYAKIALESKSLAMQAANAAEAAKYYGIADRLASVEARSTPR